MSKILVVVDMQNDFVDGTLGTEEAVGIVPSVIKEIKDKQEKGYIVFATRDTHFNKEQNPKYNPAYEDSLEGKKLPVKHCIINSRGWEIYPAIMKELDVDNIINKLTFGSFELMERLKLENNYEKIEEIEFIGLCTDICVVSNSILARATFKDTVITVKENCCAGVTPQTHKMALETMKMCQIDII